jgi:hypothetical protein
MDAFFQPAEISFVYLHAPADSITAGAYHGAPDFVQPSPCGLITSEPKNTLKAKRTGTVFLGYHPPDRPKPNRQGRPSSLEDRACYYGNMFPASRSHEQTSLSWPARIPATTNTSESIRPTQLEKIRPARLLCGEARFKLCNRSRIVFHERKHYILWPLESRGYPPLKDLSIMSIGYCATFLGSTPVPRIPNFHASL